MSRHVRVRLVPSASPRRSLPCVQRSVDAAPLAALGVRRLRRVAPRRPDR